MKTRRFKAVPALLALCLALAGCSEALGSRPVVVSDNSPAYSNGSPSQPGGSAPPSSSPSQPGGSAPPSSSAALLAGVGATEAGTVYLDVTDEMYATGRYGEKPDAAGCISAAQAADLAAKYAGAFVSYGAEGGIWKLNLGTGDILQPGKTLWLCILSLPKWSQDPAALPDGPPFQEFTPQELALLDQTENAIHLTLDAATGRLVYGSVPDPTEQLMALIFQAGYPPEKLDSYIASEREWLAGEEAKATAGSCFEQIVGSPPASLVQTEREIDFSARDSAGQAYTLAVCGATGRLIRFYQVEEKNGGNTP